MPSSSRPRHDALYECSLAAIQAGKHVLAEKPIGIDEKEAAQLEEAVARSNVCFMAGYSFRYIAAWQKVRELLQAGAVGEIHTMTGDRHPSHVEGLAGKPRYGRRADALCRLASGGPDPLVHGRRSSRGDCRYPLSRGYACADETTTFQIQFGRGAVAQGMVTQTAHAGLYSSLDIYGRQGRIGLHGVGFTYSIDVVSSALPAYNQPTTIHLPQVEDLRILMHQPQLAEFAQAIREQRQPACTVMDGRRVLNVLDTFIRSERTSQPVRIG